MVAQPSHRVAQEASEYLDKIAKGEVRRLSLGLGNSVDRETYGAESENLIIIAGETKGGKTLTAINVVAANIGLGIRVLVVTTEVSAVSYMLRLVSRQTHIPLSRMRDGMDATERECVGRALDRNKRLPLFIADRPLCNLDEISEAVWETAPELVVVDHLQRIQYTGDNPALGYKNVALKLKNLAVTNRIPIVLLSQVTFGEGWCEQMSDGSLNYHIDRMTTRWSKEPVMEADKVLVLHNRGLYRKDLLGDANLVVHSMRDYPSGSVLPLKMNPAHQFIGDYERYAKEYQRGPS
jgi:replicative DNA helicase